MLRERIRAKIEEIYGDSKTTQYCPEAHLGEIKSIIKALDTPEEINVVIDALYEMGVLQ